MFCAFFFQASCLDWLFRFVSEELASPEAASAANAGAGLGLRAAWLLDGEVIGDVQVIY